MVRTKFISPLVCARGGGMEESRAREVGRWCLTTCHFPPKPYAISSDTRSSSSLKNTENHRLVTPKRVMAETRRAFDMIFPSWTGKLVRIPVYIYHHA